MADLGDALSAAVAHHPAPTGDKSDSQKHPYKHP